MSTPLQQPAPAMSPATPQPLPSSPQTIASIPSLSAPPMLSPAPDTSLPPVPSPAVDTLLPPVTSPPPPPVTSPPALSPATDNSLPLPSPPPPVTSPSPSPSPSPPPGPSPILTSPSPSPPPGPSPILTSPSPSPRQLIQTPPPTRKPTAPLPPESQPPKPSNSPAAEKPNPPPPKPSNSPAAEKPNPPPLKPSNSPAAQKPNRPPPPLPSIRRPSKSPPPASNIPSPTISSPIPLPPASNIPSPAVSSAISSPPAPKLASPLLPPSSTISSPSPSSPKNGGLPTALQIQKPRQNQSTGLIAGCVILGIVVLAVLLLSLACVYYRRRRTQWRELHEDFHKATNSSPKDSSCSVLPQNSSTSIQINGSEIPNPPQAKSSGVFTYDQLVVATDAFSESKLIGQGGFGLVYKGVLPSGKEVAVKQMKTGSRQGEREFQAEVDTITRVHHKHLVSLVGYCITGSERLLVYDFVPNDTLEFHLHGKREHVLEWATRLKIAIGAAKGLAYLHGDCNATIIHRDIKASNILLDFRFEAKVSDFGLARSCSDNSHISTRVVGTFGYLAPEYASSGKVTEKSDVYSYGVVLLELITGRTPITTIESLRNEGLVEWARPLLARALELGDFDALVDPKLEGNYSADEMARMVACAAACVRHSAWLRPRMSLIVHTLEGHASLKDLHEGITPGNSTFFNSSGNLNYNANQYKNDIHNFNITIADQASASGLSMQSGSTSEYGIITSPSSSEAQQTFRNQ